MDVKILTLNQLQQIKEELLEELKELLKDKVGRSIRKEWLTEKEACEFLDVSKSTIQNYRKDGVLSFSQYGNKIKYRYEDVIEFINANYVGNARVRKY